MNAGIEFTKKTALAYDAVCKPLCRELGLPQTAFDILMFLANNSEYTTAGDIVNIRRIKPNLVSVNVDRLVRSGYLERRSVSGDRRKTSLLLTERAEPIVRRGREVQERFSELMFRGLTEAERESFLYTLAAIGRNLDSVLKETS